MRVRFMKDYHPWSKGQTANLVDNCITEELLQRKVIQRHVPKETVAKQLDAAPKNKEFKGAAKK